MTEYKTSFVTKMKQLLCSVSPSCTMFKIQTVIRFIYVTNCLAAALPIMTELYFSFPNHSQASSALHKSMDAATQTGRLHALLLEHNAASWAHSPVAQTTCGDMLSSLCFLTKQIEIKETGVWNPLSVFRKQSKHLDVIHYTPAIF